MNTFTLTKAGTKVVNNKIVRIEVTYTFVINRSWVTLTKNINGVQKDTGKFRTTQARKTWVALRKKGFTQTA